MSSWARNSGREKASGRALLLVVAHGGGAYVDQTPDIARPSDSTFLVSRPKLMATATNATYTVAGQWSMYKVNRSLIMFLQYVIFPDK